MKIAPLLILLLALFLVRDTYASGGPVVSITTTAAGLHYRLVPGTVHPDKEAKTIEEVGTWISNLYKEVPESRKDVLLIYTDDQTSFATVLDLLLGLKAAGVELFMVGRIDARGNGEVFQYLRGKADHVGTNGDKTTSAGK